MEEIELSRWLFEGRLRQCKNVMPDGLNWLCYFACSSKSHCENSISSILLESPHQVDMKNFVKCYKHFFGYFNALKTHGEPFCASKKEIYKKRDENERLNPTLLAWLQVMVFQAVYYIQHFYHIYVSWYVNSTHFAMYSLSQFKCHKSMR